LTAGCGDHFKATPLAKRRSLRLGHDRKGAEASLPENKEGAIDGDEREFDVSRCNSLAQTVVLFMLMPLSINKNLAIQSC
jgi:hypothetical protein